MRHAAFGGPDDGRHQDTRRQRGGGSRGAVRDDRHRSSDPPHEAPALGGGGKIRYEDAEDLVGDALLAAFQRRDAFRRGGKRELEEWLMAFVQNGALHLRRRNAHGSAIQDAEPRVARGRRRSSLLAGLPVPDIHVDQVARSDRLDALSSVLERCLDNSERDLIVGHYLRGATVRALAADAGISPATVIERLSAGLERVHKELVRRSSRAVEEWL